MKKITIAVPCYNEEKNVELMAKSLVEQMELLENYDYEIIFRDNASSDNTLEKLRRLAANNYRIKVIVNARNYGLDPSKNTFLGRITGDAVLYIPCDFQEPPELIPEFIKWWEKGYEVVAGQKIASEEGFFRYLLRQVYYGIIELFSDIPQYKNVSGIFLMSRRVAELLWRGNPDSYFRYFISDLGCPVKLIQYKQKKRAHGKSSFNVAKYFNFAINSLVQTSLVPLRLVTVLGIVLSMISFFVGVIYLILKLTNWNQYPTGSIPLILGMFFLGSVQMIFLGLVGEYVGGILKRVSTKTPPVVSELINIDTNDEYLFPHPHEDDPVKMEQVDNISIAKDE